MYKKPPSSGSILVVALSGMWLGAAWADFDPVLLTPGSFNADVIVERGASPPLPTGTNVSMDGGVNNNGNTWYEQGYNGADSLSGLPLAGTTVVHAADSLKSYKMPPTYVGNNAIFIASGVTTATLTVPTPAAYSQLSFLGSAGGGACVMSYVVRHADSSTETGNLTVGDWFNGANAAYITNGRVQLDSGAFNNVASGNPRLYSHEIFVSNTSPVTSVDFTYTSGGRSSIFALAGANDLGAWTAVTIGGFNKDVVMGLSDPPVAALTTASTVSMDGGTGNTGNTWYERGYYPQAPTTGLPVQGSTITSSSMSDHRYTMPADYAAPNAVYVDSINRTASITLATPTAYSALSFLNATANGAVTIQCTMRYEGGASEVQMFTAKDWFNGTPFAFNSAGRVNLNNRSLNNYVAGTNPRLYEAEFFLSKASSKLLSVDLEFMTGGATARVAILAVSATAGAVRPIFGSVQGSVVLYGNVPVTLTTTVSGGDAPITLRWQKGAGEVFTDLVDGGTISGATTSALTFTPVSKSDSAEYRLVATNGAGVTTAVPAKLTVLSHLPDVTSPGDLVATYGGTAPGAESEVNAIDNTTQKYLNFGSGPNPNAAPFVGPAGLVVTPAAGGTVVSGLRVYAANDAVGRDPVDYTLEGSTDGGVTYTAISSGPLSVPDGRNASNTNALNPLGLVLAEVVFTNAVSYTTYRVGFNSVKTPAGVNSMQIAEIELLGTLPAGFLTVTPDGLGGYTIRCNRSGMLQSTMLLGAPDSWITLQPIGPQTPYFFVPLAGENVRFYRALIN